MDKLYPGQYPVKINGKIVPMRRQEMIDHITDSLTCNIYDDDMPAIIEFMEKYWHPDPLAESYNDENSDINEV